MIRKIILILFFFITVSCGTSKKQVSGHKINSNIVFQYLEQTSDLSGIPQNKFYYVSTASDSDFLKKIQPSILTFVKGNKTAIIDNLQLPENKNVQGLNSSCGINEVTKKIIQYNLKSSSDIDYKTMVLKNLKNYQKFNFPKDSLVSVLLYSKKMGSFANQYVEAAKRLKKEFSIDYIIVTMDGEELKDIEDIYYDSFNNDVQIQVN
ncbi:MAG: hypothetical protein L0J60_00565 [Psychroflexus sp.]|nr:hypothetical protein [Psychroflexus sp.]